MPERNSVAALEAAGLDRGVVRGVDRAAGLRFVAGLAIALTPARATVRAIAPKAANWRTPTLLMYAGADKLVNPEVSRRFATVAAQSRTVKPGMVTAKCFDGYYHELFNEPEPAPVFELLRTWLDARF